MLYAASVKVCCGKNHRRIDIIVEADDPEKAKAKVVKQARKIYAPGKKATYEIIGMVSEAEAFEKFFARMKETTEAEGPDAGSAPDEPSPNSELDLPGPRME